jgi:DNA invertase Pin-like site-specific DNA recombinase
LRDYAEKNGYVVAREYIDEAESGRIADRPQFRRMLDEASLADSPFQEILVWKFSRFARFRVDSAIYKHRLKKHGVRIISIQEHFDDTPSGRLMEHIIEDIDEFYSDNLSVEVRFGQRKVAERGYWPGNRAPYGYNLQKVREEGGNAYHNIFVIDPLTAPIVRRIIEEAKAGHSQRDIRKGLDRDGIPPPEDPFTEAKKAKAGKWSDSTIWNIVHELKYTGLIVWGVNSTSGLPPVIAKGRHEPIVDPDDREEAARAMSSKGPSITHPRNAGSVYMLSGLLFCRLCGMPLSVRPSKNQTSKFYQCYTRKNYTVEVCHCPNLNVQKMQERVLSAVLDDILCTSNIQRALKKMAEELTGPYEEKTSRLRTIENELTEVTNRKAVVMDAHERGTYTPDEFTQRIAPLREREAELRQHLANAARDTDHQAEILAKPEEILAFATQVADFIKHSPPKERKQMLRKFIQCIWIEPGKGTIVYRIPLPEDAARPKATELVLDLDDPVPPIGRVSPHTRR